MNKLVCMLAVTAAVSMLGVRAEDDLDGLAADAGASSEGSDEGSDDSSGEGASAEADSNGETEEAVTTGDAVVDSAMKASKPKEKRFHILPFCRHLELSSQDNGTACKAEVKTPLATEWVPIKEGRFYPLGSVYRTEGSQTRLTIQFGSEIEVSIKGEASFGTRAQNLGEKSRTVTLGSGTITVSLPRNLPEGLFVVSAPGFKSINPTGEARYTYVPNEKGDGDIATIRCVTGSLTIEGRHFKVLSMKAANEIKIRTSQDLLFTGLYGSRGDYLVRLDQGRVLVKDFETGESKPEDKVLDWKLSPQTAVRIHRGVPAIGERMSVTVMTFDASGELKNRCAFAEKLVEVNSGELGPTSKKDREEIAKKAAEATETVSAGADAAATEEAAPAEEKAEDSAAAGNDLEF